MLGTSTLAAEVAHVLPKRFWLHLGREELFVPYDEFPWFKQATIEQICILKWPTADTCIGPCLVLIFPSNPSATPRPTP